MDVEQEFRRILQNNRFGIIGKSHRSKCFKDFSDRYQEAMERALSCSRNVARERGPEEGGGDPREGGPGEDSTSEDGPACECVPVEGSGVAWFIAVRQNFYKKFFVPWDNDRPRPWRGPRVKKKKKCTKSCPKDGYLSAALFIISLKICLIISFVMSLMCSALIPLLSQAFPSLSLLIADCISSAMISGISFLSHSLYCSPSLLDLQNSSSLVVFGICTQIAVEFTDYVGNSISRCNHFTFVVFEPSD